MLAAVHITHPDVPGWNFAERHAVQLAAAIPGADVRICRSEKEFLAVLPEAQVALVWHFRPEWIPLAANLRLLGTPAAGQDYFPGDLLPARIERCYGRFHGLLMGETVVGMLLGMCRGLLPAAVLQTANPWPRREIAAAMRPLRGARVTILGFGHIGRHAARLLKPFGVHLTGIRRSPAPAPPFLEAVDRVLGPAELDRVLPETDHLVLCLPAAAETDGLMDRRRLELLPPGATLCNVGRGNALDEEALLDGLREGRLAGACLDVFRQEPLPPDSPLRTCPNLWIMPHAAAIAPNYLDLFVTEFGDRWRAGEFGLSRPD
ncbi:MAG: D-2-hydroxyacid dehydrogenase [Lentisphaeria bacterium]|jgi:phosphoglycerate dehydrogenase-like enzyme|nr:D-2-hydroxyacid dehydrogenase [Lentisphaeria bacterium]